MKNATRRKYWEDKTRTEFCTALPNRFNTVADYNSFVKTGSPKPIEPFSGDVDGMIKLNKEWVNAPLEQVITMFSDAYKVKVKPH